MKKPSFPLEVNKKARKSAIERIEDRVKELKDLKQRQLKSGPQLINLLTKDSFDKRISKLENELRAHLLDVMEEARKLKENPNWSLQEEVTADKLQSINNKIQDLVQGTCSDTHEAIREQLGSSEGSKGSKSAE